MITHNNHTEYKGKLNVTVTIAWKQLPHKKWTAKQINAPNSIIQAHTNIIHDPTSFYVAQIKRWVDAWSHM